MGNSHREAIPSYCKWTPCTVSEKNWNTKEDKGKPMMHVLYVLRWRKGTCQDEAMSNSEEIKHVAIQVMLG